MSIDVSVAEATLRPDVDALLRAWHDIVEAERLQVESLPDRPRPEDFYGPVAESFRADPHRTDDVVLNAILELTRPDETWLDLGAGAGRYTLAIAMHVARMIAVEPSAGMRSQLEAGRVEAGIENLEVYAERWPGPSRAPIADVGFMSQVGYDIADIGPFIAELEEHARRLCVAVLFAQAPIADFAPLWLPVHGEPRVILPGVRELVGLLYARGRLPEVRYLSLPGRVYTDLEAVHRASRRPLWVLEGSAADERLAAAVRDLAVPHEGGGYRLGGPQRALAIVTWRPH